MMMGDVDDDCLLLLVMTFPSIDALRYTQM
jgi:hypothetical protein